jgi:hypothetical protein
MSGLGSKSAKPKYVTWMIARKGTGVTEYWVLGRRWPRWVFYLLVALWPKLGRGYENHGRWAAKSQ